ncbi:MAG: hypothetical protein IT452_02620 [Planctomycetia bacterium]|nr:hypothetical protein [Planctomycetia bacterium]
MRFHAAWLLLAAAVAVRAQEAGPPPEPDPAPPLVERLAADDPDTRQDAYRQLRKLRRAALPALRQGVLSKDAEVAAACRELVGLVERSSMKLEDGRIPEGTPWWKAREARVSARFVQTPLAEIVAAAREDLGFSIRVSPPGANLPDRTVTATFEGAPLEFVLGWLLYSSVDPNSYVAPRLGWTGKEAILSSDPRPGDARVTVDYGAADALQGIAAGDLRALASFIEDMGKSDSPSATVKQTDAGLRITASPFTQVEASRVIDAFRRAAAGLRAPGADLDERAIAAGEKLVFVRWQQTPLEEALAELGEKTGVPWRLDRRASQWASDAYHLSPQEEPARVVAMDIASRWSNARLDQRWGAWWISVDQGGGARELAVRPAGDFVRRMMMSDRTWQPGGIETWLKTRKPDPSGRGIPSAGATAVAWFPDSSRVAISAPRSVVDSLDLLFASRIGEGEARLARIEGRAAAPAAQRMTPEEMGRRIAERLAREKVTKELKSEGFRENEVFQEVFRYLHDALQVGSTSGSLSGGGRNRPIRACRLQETSARVIWQWLNEGSLSWFLTCDPERRTASWGLGMSSSWDTVPAGPQVNRALLHPSWEKEYLAFLEAYDAEAKKSFAAEPGMPGAPAAGPVKLPRAAAERFFAATGLDPTATADAEWTAAAAPAALDVAIDWPAAELTLEETLFKLAEIADLSFILDVPQGAGPTRKVAWEASSRAPRAILDQAVEAAGVSWAARSEGVIWVTARRGDERTWVWLEGGAPLGAEEAAAAAAEFAKSGDQLLCFGPTARFAAKCAPGRVGDAQAAFDRAKAAAREAAREEAATLEAAARDAREVPAGLAGAMALEAAAAGGSAEASLALARRIAAGGHLRTAWRRLMDLITSNPDAALLARAQAAAASLAARFGPADPGMDAEAVRLSGEALAAADLPAESQAEALEAAAEAWRRAGDADRALECLRRVESLGFASEDTRRWRSKLESLPPLR